MKDITILQWLQNYKAGKYKNTDVDTQIDAGWYDWFCKDTSLAGKTRKLAPKVKKIAGYLGKDFQMKHYVFFKNNCPLYGKLYDDFRFCDMKTGDVIYTITPAEGYTQSFGRSAVWGKSNNFEKALVEGTWNDVLNYFKNINEAS